MVEEHGEYKFNREQRRRLDNRRAGAHEHNRMGRGYSLPDWQPYNHNQNHENGKGDLERPARFKIVRTSIGPPACLI